ncbi:hypothetical protein [uncultured Gemmiger sp.]|uniref:hypothetical protein n=1 Tax=uncultured Gemmiger sp. TaxID=1623490 RepID=UPI0025FBEF10|nr:hypothetical protein [uncultured Gemmiger sp.]
MSNFKEKAMLAVMKARAGLMETKEEDAGMEILQVLILLAIGLGLIALFIGFGNRITDAVSEQVDDFMSVFGG